MYLSYVNLTTGDRDNYPNIISFMRVSYGEVIITYKDALDSIEVRRLKLDSSHEIQVYV